MPKPFIGISSCLVGKNVRYDGGNKKNSDLVHWFSENAELILVCPEMAIGLGVPRPPIQLCDNLESPEARQVDNPEIVFTQPLAEFGHSVAKNVVLDGYIFKSRSPSCGIGSAPVFISGIIETRTVSGIYASAIQEALPFLPITEAEQLQSENDYTVFLASCIDFQKTRLATD